MQLTVLWESPASTDKCLNLIFSRMRGLFRWELSSRTGLLGETASSLGSVTMAGLPHASRSDAKMINNPRYNAETPNFLMEHNISHLKVICRLKRFWLTYLIYTRKWLNIVLILFFTRFFGNASITWRFQDAELSFWQVLLKYNPQSRSSTQIRLGVFENNRWPGGCFR